MPGEEDPIKIVQVIARMNVGGPAVLIDIVHRGLDRHGFDPQLWTGDVEPGEIDYLVVRGSPDGVRKIEGLGRSVRFAGDLRALANLVRLMHRERPDVVHTHTAKAGVVGRLAALITRVPVRVHTYHGHVLHGYFSPWATRAITLIEKLLARGTTSLVAVGSHVRDDLLAVGIGKPNKFTVVAPGVEIEASASRVEARRRLGIPEEAAVILFVGRLTSIKRPDRLIDAFRLVRAAMPRTVLVIAGEGDLYERTRINAAGLGESVHFLGWQSDLSGIYPVADVVVLTSDNEGMPVTLIEASMLGVPCVTTDVGSAGEVVIDRETGLVTGTEPQQIAHALAELLGDNQLRTRLSTDARRYAEQRFGAERLVSDHADLYRRLLHDRQGR